MNILILNSVNPYKRGGIFVLELRKNFILNGHNCFILVKDYDKNYEKGIESIYSQYSFFYVRLINKLVKLFNSILLRKKYDEKYYFKGEPAKKSFFKTKNILKKVPFTPEVIIYVFPQNFLTVKNLNELNSITKVPVIWFLADMAPMTGGCHYSYNCKGYTKACGNCPALLSNNPNDISNQNLKFKQYYLEKTNIIVVTGSEYQYKQALSSTIFKNKPIYKILIAIDDLIFKPDRIEARKYFNIPENKKVIFIGSANIQEERKGYKLLLKALTQLEIQLKKANIHDSVLLLIAGNDYDFKLKEYSFDTKYVGYIQNQEILAKAYQAANVFVCPSIEDSGPMMINQSIMCGTPVVAFKMGVALDLVVQGETGYRVELFDIDNFAKSIYNIITLMPEKFEQMSDNCRKLGMERLSYNKQFEDIKIVIKKSLQLKNENYDNFKSN